MKKTLVLLCLIFIVFLTSCRPAPSAEPGPDSEGTGGQLERRPDLISTEGSTLKDRIRVPAGFTRVPVAKGSFAEYLRDLPLKPHGARVQYYNGETKRNDVYTAVFAIDIGERDLQQCADAVIRLRAEYLYREKLYDRIHFNFTNGFRADYEKWAQGYRISVQGDTVNWVKRAAPSTAYDSFRDYLNLVFAYAGSASLARELQPADLADMQIGDVFIQGGHPGHCVIVVDMAENKETGERLFLIAQSYMPAQDIHLLSNPGDRDLSPWYTVDFGEVLTTPEWSFGAKDLKRFGE